jgi:putative ABC transport system substrate-binding protein
MRHRTIGLILILSLFTAQPAANAQQRGKVPLIGVLLPGSPTPEYERRLDAFRQGLRELGYIDTQNILLEYRWADAQYERMADLVAELLRLKVDVLVIDSTPAGWAAKRATSTLPIVLAVAGDPVGTGLVESLARPGGNITGNSLMHPEVSAKRLGLLKYMVPTAARVAVLLNPDNPLPAPMARDRGGGPEARRAASGGGSAACHRLRACMLHGGRLAGRRALGD